MDRLEAFDPGDPARILAPGAWGGALRPGAQVSPGTVCEAEVPCRLHASVIDMNRFDVGAPGGGGLGFGVGLSCRARVCLSEGRGVESRGTRPAVALHFGELFRTLSGYGGRIEVEAEDHGWRHLGLGSSIATITAVALALNEGLGRILNLRDLRKLIAHNYCEEAPGDSTRLVPGFETNVGAMVAIHGGMVVATDGCELAYRVPLPERMRALLLLPLVGTEATSGEGEARALLERARNLDRRDRGKKAEQILLEILPAMIRGDFRTVGEAVHALTRLGSKRAECELHGRRGREIYGAMKTLRSDGAEIVSMSSVGPAVFALSEDPQVWERWQAAKASSAAASVLELPVDNVGARVRLDGVPIPYGLEPWWHQPDPRTRSGTGRPPDGPEKALR